MQTHPNEHRRKFTHEREAARLRQRATPFRRLVKRIRLLFAPKWVRKYQQFKDD